MEVVETAAARDALVAKLGRAKRLAVDVESNGMHAYRARVCTVQLAWEEDGGVCCAVVDTLAVEAASLAPLLDHRGPEKVLHDLGFDARILAGSGVRLGRVSDTEVMARMLGRRRMGLAALLEEVGGHVSKDLQRHDWARRPLSDVELEYLAGDVRHLFALWDHLTGEVRRAGVEPEVEEETQHKLLAALRPAERRAAPSRVKELAAEDDLTQSVMLELLAERERVAERLDLPPYKVVNNDALLLVARRRPVDAGALAAIPGMQRAARSATAWLAAVARGTARGAPPEEPEEPREDRDSRAARSRREAALRTFRREESVRRGVDEQVILPGHTIDALARAAPATVERLYGVAGLGALRVARYGEQLVAMLASAANGR